MLGKQNQPIWCLQEAHFKPNDKYRLQVKEWKDLYQSNTRQKKAGVSILMSDKVDITKKNIARYKDIYFLMMMWSINQKDIKILNASTPNIIVSTFMIQTLLEL